MQQVNYLTLLFCIISNVIFAQSIEDSFSHKKMKKDVSVFKEIRIKANSGLYKYRTKKQIDSIYNWAENEIKNLSTYREFYNLICTLTNFEGSLHNDTSIPDSEWQNLREEKYGYFPFPIKWIKGKWLINFKDGEIPIGAEIISINNVPISEIITNLNKYYTTDGQNKTGKRIGIRTHFARYYRLAYGLTNSFKIKFLKKVSNKLEAIEISGVSHAEYYNRFNNRHSKPYDQIYYAALADNKKYNFKKLDSLTGILTIHSFSMGNETSIEHKNYVRFLDSVFTKIKDYKFKNLIVDVRQNGGGTDPNDLVTYSYLTQRTFQENKQAWIRFNKIPLIKYYNIGIPKFIRPLFVGKYNREFQETFPLQKDGRYYQNENSDDHKIRTPNKNAFTGSIYLLTSPAIASAGSLFASMVAGNDNTITIGEETMGGYYGHNGHTSMEYKLPKSKIVTQFSVVNLEQDVQKKSNQIHNRGIIPDYNVNQNFDDYLNQEDTQMNFVLELIKKNLTE